MNPLVCTMWYGFPCFKVNPSMRWEITFRGSVLKKGFERWKYLAYIYTPPKGYSDSIWKEMVKAQIHSFSKAFEGGVRWHQSHSMTIFLGVPFFIRWSEPDHCHASHAALFEVSSVQKSNWGRSSFIRGQWFEKRSCTIRFTGYAGCHLSNSGCT